MYIDHKEIEEFLSVKIPDQTVCYITMALILEYTGKNTDALKKWRELKTDEGCIRTVNILRKSSIASKETIFEYLEWVLEKNPILGLSLFIDRK